MMHSPKIDASVPSDGVEPAVAPNRPRISVVTWALPPLLLLLMVTLLLPIGDGDVPAATLAVPASLTTTAQAWHEASGHDSLLTAWQEASSASSDPSTAEVTEPATDAAAPTATTDPAAPATSNAPTTSTTVSVPLDLPVTLTVEVPLLDVSVDTRPRWEVVGQQAMDRLRYVDITGLGWRVEFHAGRDGYLGIADPARRVVDIWIRDSHDVNDVLGTLAHELTHVLDYERFTDEVRATWSAMRGLGTWWPTCTCDDRDHGAGDIAEAMVILEAGIGEWTGRNGVPTASQLAWLASIVA